MNPLVNINIGSVTELPAPREIQRELPVPARTQLAVLRARAAIEDVLDGRDGRLLVIVGPCSIHDAKSGLEYAQRLAELARTLDDELLIVMRVYFEKPRTAIGWKGLINDPFMDDSFQIDQGLRLARRFLLDVAALGLPAGTEALDPVMPQYIGDLIAWTAIGARTAESQTHREMASGLSTPVGFKNGTDGSFDSAINAIRAAMRPHHFLGVTAEGRQAVFATTGNPYPHIVLRGGHSPNYSSSCIRRVEQALASAKLPQRILVDCSHGNSERDPRKQADVLRDCLAQIENGNNSIIGFMMESHLHWGQQPIQRDPTRMDYGVSVTDACMDWDTTETLLRELHEHYGLVRAKTTAHGNRSAGHARLLALLAALTLGGCSLQDEVHTLRQQQDLPATPLAADRIEHDLGHNVPVVHVDRVPGRREFVYRLQGQQYNEQELLGLCRTLVANDPEALVALAPSAALTADEVGLIEARLREAGVRRIRRLTGTPTAERVETFP